MSKSRGPEQTPPETTKDLDPSPTHAPEGFGAMDMSPEGLHERSLGNSERASRLGLGGADNTPALSDLNVEDWMNEPEASDVEHAPLPYKSELERGFGADLSGVTVRLGAHEELDAQGAEATAEGETLSFASTHPDRELVAHEVAHLVQSREHGGSTSGRLSDPNEAAEQEADEAAKTVAEGGQAELKEGVTGVMRATKTKKTNGPKNNSRKKKLIQRWGITIEVGTHSYDTFKAESGTKGLASDGSVHQTDVGGEALNINFNKPRQMTSPGNPNPVPHIMARLVVRGGNCWIPLASLSNEVLKGQYARDDQPKWRSVANVARSVGKELRSELPARTAARAGKKINNPPPQNLAELRENIQKNCIDVLSVFGTWKDGWNAEMADQIFIVEGCRVKHKASSLASGNLLKDYLPVDGKPLYLNMNVPTGDVAPVVRDVLPPSNANDPLIGVRHVRTKTTGLYTAYDTAIQKYVSKHKRLVTTFEGADEALKNANTAIDEFNKAGSSDSEKFADLNEVVRDCREARRSAEINIDNTVEKMPLSKQKIGRVEWRYVEIDIPSASVPTPPGSTPPGSTPLIKTSGWVPYSIAVKKP